MKISELEFRDCPYCEFKKKAKGEIIHYVWSLPYDFIRKHILEKHPEKIKEFIENCENYVREKNATNKPI